MFLSRAPGPPRGVHPRHRRASTTESVERNCDLATGDDAADRRAESRPLNPSRGTAATRADHPSNEPHAGLDLRTRREELRPSDGRPVLWFAAVSTSEPVERNCGDLTAARRFLAAIVSTSEPVERNCGVEPPADQAVEVRVSTSEPVERNCGVRLRKRD